MIVSVNQARRIIQAHYGKEMKFRITTACTMGVRPNFEIVLGIPMLAWAKIASGDSLVKIGKLHPTGMIDWNWVSDKVKVN